MERAGWGEITREENEYPQVQMASVHVYLQSRAGTRRPRRSRRLLPPSEFKALILRRGRRLILGPHTELESRFRENAARDLGNRATSQRNPKTRKSVQARPWRAEFWRLPAAAARGPLSFSIPRWYFCGSPGSRAGLHFPICSGGGAEASPSFYQ